MSSQTDLEQKFKGSDDDDGTKLFCAFSFSVKLIFNILFYVAISLMQNVCKDIADYFFTSSDLICLRLKAIMAAL